MSIIGNPLLLGGSGGSSGPVFITDELDENGGIVRHIDTDPENITDTVDEHGGIVRSITGVEVPLQVKEVTPTGIDQVVEADEGYAALGKVIVKGASSQMIVGITEVNGVETADHTFEEIFNALSSGTPVYLRQTAGSWDGTSDIESGDYHAQIELMPVVTAYKYDTSYRIAAAWGQIRFAVVNATNLFYPAMYILQAASLQSYPTFYKKAEIHSDAHIYEPA